METVKKNRCHHYTCSSCFFKTCAIFLFIIFLICRTKWIIRRILLGLFEAWALSVFIGFILMFLPRNDDSQRGIIGFTDDSGIEGEVVSVYFQMLNGVWIETIYIYLIDRSY